MHAMARCIHQDGRRSVHHIACRNLRVSRLQDRRLQVWAMVGWQPTQHTEDSSDVDINIDVRRAIQRIEHDDVFAGFNGAVESHRLFILFAHQRSHGIAQAEAVQQSLVGVHVELLLLLALNIRLAHCTEYITQPSRANLRLDHLGSKSNSAEQPAESSSRLADLLLLLQDVLLHCRNHLSFSLRRAQLHHRCRELGSSPSLPVFYALTNSKAVLELRSRWLVRRCDTHSQSLLRNPSAWRMVYPRTSAGFDQPAGTSYSAPAP